MQPCSFDESNCIINSSKTATAALIINNLEGDQSIVTCWKMDKSDLAEFVKTGRCYLVIRGTEIPSCYISVHKPFEIREDDVSDTPGFSDN